MYRSKSCFHHNVKQIRFRSNIATAWKDGDDPHAFIGWASNHLSIKEPDDWYKITPKVIIESYPLITQQLHEIGGSDILHRFNGLPYLLLQSTMPNHKWLPWKFSSLPRSYWDDTNNQRYFINWAETQLKIKHKSEWYKIDIEVFFFSCKKYLNKRNCIALEDFSSQETTSLYTIFCLQCTLIMTGCHGNSLKQTGNISIA